MFLHLEPYSFVSNLLVVEVVVEPIVLKVNGVLIHQSKMILMQLMVEAVVLTLSYG